LPTRLDESASAVRYLLGELSEHEAKGFEDRFFADDQVSEELQISEAEIIDAYVANELSARQRKHLEQRLAASPRLQQRVAFARTFAQFRRSRDTAPNQEASRAVGQPWWSRLFAVPVVGALTPAGAFAVFLIVVALGAAVVQSVRLRNESRRFEAERAELARQRDELAGLSAAERDRAALEMRDAQARYERAEELVRSLQQREGQVRPPKQPSIFAALSLLPGSLRSGGGGNDLVIPPGATGVHLKLALLRIDYHSYKVTINGPSSEKIYREGIRPTRDRTLAISLPANLFQPGQYTVQVSATAQGAVEPVSDYAFRVVRK